MSKRKKILMGLYGEIEYDGRVQRSAEALSVAYDVTVVSIDSGHAYSNRAFDSLTVELPTGRHSQVPRHLVFWVRFWKIARREKPDLVYAHDYFMTLSGWVAARLTGARLVYDAHELVIPDAAMPSTPRERIFYAMERWVVSRADRVAAANPERAELMQQHYRLLQPPFVVRNFPASPPRQSEQFDPIAAYPRLARPEHVDVRLVFQGNMSCERRIGEFITALRHLERSYDLLLVGGGPDLLRLQEQATAEGVGDRVVFLGKVPRDHLCPVLRSCDIGIVSYSSRGLNNVYCAPNKIHEYAQAGLPVLVSSQPPLRSAVERYAIGGFVDLESGEQSAAERVAEAARDLAGRLEACRAEIPRFLSDNRWEAERDRLRSVIDQVCA